MAATTEVTPDVKDRKILAEMDMGARQPLSSIAKKVGLSREVVNYRIRQLERRKVILGYYTVLDTAKLGLIYCRMFFKYRKMPAEKQDELLAFCAKHRNISWTISGEGRWDIVLVVLARSLGEIEATYDELNNLFGQHFQNQHVSIAYWVREFRHKYLYPSLKMDNDGLVVGKGGKAAGLDGTDYEIVDILSKDATASLVGIAKTTGLTPKVVGYRIKHLIEKKVILGFRAIINNKLLGYDHYKVFLTLQDIDEKNLARVTGFLRYHPNVIYITKPMGPYTLEFEAMVRNTNELHEIMQQFKQQLGDILVDYDIYFNYEVRSIRYLPALATSEKAT
ncbi:Lrp/AsnC family transcriptional regulator [Candidatus Woesearchaeota archaeon]|nr:Lrp/AsnC family transcriptional regulator [Candidatus Woesearchaeota archaeon]